MLHALRALRDALLFPTAAFESARHLARPAVALVVGLSCVTPMVAGLAFLSQPGAERLLQRRVTERIAEKPHSAPDDDAANSARVARGLKAAKLLVVAAPPAKRLLALLLLAGLGFLALRGPVPALSFSACLAVVGVGAAPLLLADLSRAGLALLHGGVDPRLLLRSNLALWLDADLDAGAGALLRAVDLFRLWSVWLTGRGLQVLRGQPDGHGPAFWLPVGLYGIVAAAAALAA